jgi:hypothetical protein
MVGGERGLSRCSQSAIRHSLITNLPEAAQRLNPRRALGRAGGGSHKGTPA